MNEHTTCRHPDKDVPGLKCGHPLPCPWHTATIVPDADPPMVDTRAADVTPGTVAHLFNIAHALREEDDDDANTNG